MNATLLAKSAYANARPHLRDPRAAEYEAFAQITAALSRAASFSERASALQDNRQLWATLATDLAHPENGLPEDLRAQLLSLSRFTSQHTSKALAGAADVETLVEINTAIMRGLGQSGIGGQ